VELRIFEAVDRLSVRAKIALDRCNGLRMRMSSPRFRLLFRRANLNAAAGGRITQLDKSREAAVPVGHRGLYGQIPLPEGQLSLAM
jgi:hypothetical protein